MAVTNAEFNKIMNQGHSAAWDLEWEKAAESYKKALDVQPNSTQALTNLASALFELGRYDESFQYYTRCAKLTPNDPLPLEKIAQILEYRKKYARAADAAYHAGELFVSLKDVDNAVRNWTYATNLAPGHMRARQRLAMTYQKLGDKGRAAQEFIYLAGILQIKNQKAQAVELVEHAIKLDPDNDDAQQALGLLRANQSLRLPKQKLSAKPILDDSQQAVDSDLSFDFDDESDSEQGDPVSAAKELAIETLASLLFDQSNEREPNKRRNISDFTRSTSPLGIANVEYTKIMLHLSQCIDLQSRGREAEAAEELERAIDAGLDTAAAYFDLGMLRGKLGRLESAQRYLLRAVKNPEYALAARLLLGKNYRTLGREAEAANQFLEALRLADGETLPEEQAIQVQQLYEPILESHSRESDEEKHAQLSKAVGNMLMRSDWREAVEKARKQIPKRADGFNSLPTPLAELLIQAESSQVIDILANIYQLRERGMLHMAMEDAFHGLKYAPTYLPLHTVIAEILLEQDLDQEAITKLNVVARAYSARGESSRAIDLFERITKMAPLDLSARNRLIEQLMAAGKVEDAVNAYIELADVHYRLAELDEARDTYQRALNVVKQSALGDAWAVRVLHRLADLDLQRLDWRRALSIFKQIMVLDPQEEKAIVGAIDLQFRLGQDRQALSTMGNSLAVLDELKQPEKAVRVLEQVAQNHEGQSAVHMTLAERYQMLGQLENAIEYYDKAADKFLDAGETDAAVDAIRKLLALGPANAAEYQEVLRELMG